LTTYFNAEKPPQQQHRFPFAATELTAKFPGFRAPSEFEASAGEAEQGTLAAARIFFFLEKLGMSSKMWPGDLDPWEIHHESLQNRRDLGNWLRNWLSVEAPSSWRCPGQTCKT